MQFADIRDKVQLKFVAVGNIEYSVLKIVSSTNPMIPVRRLPAFSCITRVGYPYYCHYAHDLPTLKQLHDWGRVSSSMLSPKYVDAQRHVKIGFPRIHGMANKLKLLNVQGELVQAKPQGENVKQKGILRLHIHQLLQECQTRYVSPYENLRKLMCSSS